MKIIWLNISELHILYVIHFTLRVHSKLMEQRTKIILSSSVYDEKIKTMAYFLFLDGFGNDQEKNYYEAERRVNRTFFRDTDKNVSNCVICGSFFYNHYDKRFINLTHSNHFMLCQDKIHPLCFNCLLSIYKNLLDVKLGSIINFNILKCPCCHIFIDYDDEQFDGAPIVILLRKLSALFNLRFPYLVSYIDVDLYNTAICKKCKRVRIHSKISCSDSLLNNDEVNFVCDICHPRFSRTVICSICNIPVIKMLTGDCNHLDNSAYCGHHICAFKDCGKAFSTEDDCWAHLDTVQHDYDIEVNTSDDDMYLCDSYKFN